MWGSDCLARQERVAKTLLAAGLSTSIAAQASMRAGERLGSMNEAAIDENGEIGVGEGGDAGPV